MFFLLIMLLAMNDSGGGEDIPNVSGITSIVSESEITTTPITEMTTAPKNEESEITSSSSSQMIYVMNDLTGKNFEIIQKSDNYKSLTFKPVYEYTDSVEKGLIFEQSIPKDENYEEGAEITVKVSLGSKYVTIPEYLSLSKKDYFALLNDAGIKYEEKELETDDANRFKKLKEVILDTGKEQLPLEIAQVKFFKNLVILKFKGIDNINDIEKYKGKSLYVTREHAVKLKKDEYFIADLIGMRAVTEEGEELGTIKDVLQTGANDVYIIKKDGEDELLVPAIKDCVKNVDIEGGVMTLHLLEGLRDINKK